MSNLVETLLDKLIFPSLSGKESPLPKTYSGSQNLVENNVKMDSALISEFHQMLNSDHYAPHYSTMNVFSGVKNINPYFDTSNSLVSRVSKLFLPSLVPLQELHLSTQAEYLLTHESYIRRGSILSEIIDQIDLFVNKGYNVKTPQKAKDMPCVPEVPQAPVKVVKQSADVPSMELSKVTLKPKAAVDNAHNSQIMNQELVNRKAKKMSKQSKKRRRRQKKSRAKNTSDAKELHPSDQENVKRIDAIQGSVSHSVGDSRDIFCDIISVTGQILPDVTSFMISVESAVDDDTDWDVCSDSDWLNDCSEFEVTGLFLGNLTAPTISSCPVKKVLSCLEVPSVQEDKEALKLKNLLLSVNKAWEESTLDLKKPRLSPKVSFAPDKDLVQVHEVDNYERKGEWEIYVRERSRFKKKIDELESVISPCLKEEHREKVFKNLQKYNL